MSIRGDAAPPEHVGHIMAAVRAREGFPHRTPGGPVPARGDAVPPEYVGQIMAALRAQEESIRAQEEAGRTQGQHFAALMATVQQQMQQQRQQQQQQMSAMQQQHRDAMAVVQAQVGDARRAADAAATDANAMYPRLNSVVEGAAFSVDKAIQAMAAHGEAQSRAQGERLQEAVSGLRAECEAALDAMRSGAAAAATVGATPGGLGAGDGRPSTRQTTTLGPKRPLSSTTPTPRVPKSQGSDDGNEYDDVRGGDSRLSGMPSPPTGSTVLIFLVVDCMAQGGRLDTEACVYLGAPWSSMLALEARTRLDLSAAVLDDAGIRHVLIPADATPIAAAQALRHKLVSLRLDSNGMTVQETTPVPWPPGWPVPASLDSVLPKYFAFVHRYTSVRVAPHVVAQHRQVLDAHDKRELVISWVLPLLQQFTKLPDIAHEELAVLRLLISVLRDAVRNGGSVGGVDAWRTPLADDTFDRRGKKPDFSFHKLPTRSLANIMDEFVEGQSNMRFHGNVKHSFMHADLHDALPQLLGESQCFSIIARALISRTTSPAHAGVYRHVFHEKTNLRKVHELCARIHDILSRQHHFPCTREEHITPDLLRQFESHLSELMVLLRTLPAATEMQEMLRHEAMRLCKAKCPPDTNMVAHVRNKLDGLTSAFFVWGDESSEWLAAHELGHFLPDLVSEMPASMRDRTMMAAEEYVKKVAENRSISLAALQEQLMRATTVAPRDAIHLQSQLRGDVLDVLGGQTTLLRFFATPHDLRRMNDLKQLQPFVHFLRRTLVGEYNYKSYIDGGTAILMQQQAAASMRSSAGNELADDNGAALDILLGTAPDMSRGPYAAYEWANCMYGAHSTPSPHMQLALRDEAPHVPAQPSRVQFDVYNEAPPAPARPRNTMPSDAPVAHQLAMQPAAPSTAGTPVAGAAADAGVIREVQAIRDEMRAAMKALADAQRRERDDYSDHLATLSRITNRAIENSQTFPGELTHARNPPGVLDALPSAARRGATLAAVVPHEPFTVLESLAREHAVLTAGDGRRGAPSGPSDGRRGGPGMRPRQPRPPQRDANGQIILRLLDKPPIPWDDVAEVIRAALLEGPTRVATAEDWERHGGSPCWLCERKDHPLNRCYRVFRLSDKGRAWAEKVQMRGPDSSAVTVADVCADCGRADTDYVCACLDTTLDEEATFFEWMLAHHEGAVAAYE